MMETWTRVRRGDPGSRYESILDTLEEEPGSGTIQLTFERVVPEGDQDMMGKASKAADEWNPAF